MNSTVSDSVLTAFDLSDVGSSDLRAFGNGHINDTFFIEKKGVILQRINTRVFPQPDELMDNIVRVTSFLKEKIKKRGGNPDRETLTFIPTREGKYYFADTDNSCWRLMKYIGDTVSYEKAENKMFFRETGLCFGSFIDDLSDFPASTLHEVIPDFHDTSSRYRQFMKALEEDRKNRVKKVKNEIEFLTEREFYSHFFNRSEFPLRVTHNDTKLNNILIDGKTGHGICVVDLDTVMPGFAAHDFGDGIRTGACTANEDERDISKVSLDFDMYRAFYEGFTDGAKRTLTDKEISTLPDGAMVITYEQALRFLSDYLNGDIYYKTDYGEHNLVRTKTQIALLSDMEEKSPAMRQI